MIATIKDSLCSGCNHSKIGESTETAPFEHEACHTVTNDGADIVREDNEPIFSWNRPNEPHVCDILKKTWVAK